MQQMVRYSHSLPSVRKFSFKKRRKMNGFFLQNKGKYISFCTSHTFLSFFNFVKLK